jgi:hypothetical protein
MRAAIHSRRKTLIAVLSVAILLLALWAMRFAPDAVSNPSSSASRRAGEAATNELPSKQAANPPVHETASTLVSNAPAIEQSPLNRISDVENPAIGEPRAAAVAAVQPSVDPNPDRRRPRIAAECWGLRGATPFDYVVTLDHELHTSGTASALISAQRESPGYVTMFQTSAAAPVRGKRVEFSADVRTRGVKRGANLLLRAEDAHGNTIAFDNMQTSYDIDRRPDHLINRGVTGDNEWSTQHVVVDIPDEARVITYGVSLFGGGKAWIDNARIEVVTDDMATTAIDALQSPTPLNGIPVNPASLTRSPKNLDFDLEAQTGTPPCN